MHIYINKKKKDRRKSSFWEICMFKKITIASQKEKKNFMPFDGYSIHLLAGMQILDDKSTIYSMRNTTTKFPPPRCPSLFLFPPCLLPSGHTRTQCLLFLI